MKKIIAIILAAFVILTMSITIAFAYTAVVKPEDPTYDVGVSVTLTEITPKDKPVEFYSVSRDGETDKDSIIEGRIATFKIEITNKTDDFIIISEVLDSFDIQVTDKNKNVLEIYSSEIDETEWKQTINANKSLEEGLTYSIKIITNDSVYFDVSLGGHTEKIEQVEEKVDFMLVKDIKETESSVTEEPSVEVTTETTTVIETTTDETTTEAPVVNDESTTEAPETTTESVEMNEPTASDNVTTTEKADDKVLSPTAPTYSDTNDDYDYVEPEIPDTGISAAPFGAAGALVVSSITALIVKKRKLK